MAGDENVDRYLQNMQIRKASEIDKALGDDDRRQEAYVMPLPITSITAAQKAN